MAERSYVVRELKLQFRPAQLRELERWLWRLSGAYNWAIRKVEADARNGIYPRHKRSLEVLVRGHGPKIGIPTHVLQAVVHSGQAAWQKCFDGHCRRPRLKSKRNRLNSIPLPDPIRPPKGRRIAIPGMGRVRFHKQDLPAGPLKCGRLIKRPSGWHLSLYIEAAPKAIEAVAHGEIGIDPGFASLLTLSTGEKIGPAREASLAAERLAQSQRGLNQRLTGRLKRREANQRLDRNHKLSHRLVAENDLIVWSKDNTKATARKFGRSVSSAAHGQLRQMLAYKCRSGGRRFVEVPARFSTVTCSSCGARSGPRGCAGLSVRQWKCGCGADHDRDVNAAVNTLIAGRGMRHESTRERASEIAA
jgi:putative transposase